MIKFIRVSRNIVSAQPINHNTSEDAQHELTVFTEALGEADSRLGIEVFKQPLCTVVSFVKATDLRDQLPQSARFTTVPGS